jgi:inner membrane protein involved in colicin E2 resistance
MVFHWRRIGGPGAVRSMLVNGLGAIVMGTTVLVVLVAKFVEGAWVTLLLIPGLFVLMVSVRRHYHHVALQIASQSPLELHQLCPPLIVVPIDRWSRVAKRALTFALTMSPEIVAVHIDLRGRDVLLARAVAWIC